MNWRIDRLQLLGVGQPDSAERVCQSRLTQFSISILISWRRLRLYILEASGKWPSKLINRDRRRRDNRAIIISLTSRAKGNNEESATVASLGQDAN